MSDFSLDLRAAEEELDKANIEEGEFGEKVILGVLDGTTPGQEWVQEIEDGHILLLAIEGDLNELAAEFARDVKEMGGSLMHFRRFLVITPPGVKIDNNRLSATNG